MSKVVFGLYDEVGYMRLLADYLERNSPKVECHLFTGKDTLEEYLKRNELDVLLLGEEVETDRVKSWENVKKQLIFTEEPVEKSETASGRIFKYQSAGEIMEMIFEQFLKLDSGVAKKKEFHGKVRFYGVFRLFENDSKILEGLLQREAAEGKTLILDFGYFSGISITGKKEKGMTELLFYLKQKTEKTARKLSGLIQEWKGVDYLPAVGDYRDLYGVTKKEVELLLQILSENTEYENVIFDIGFLGEATLYLLGKCEYVFLRQPQNQWEENKKEGFLQLLQRENMQSVVEKMDYLK